MAEQYLALDPEAVRKQAQDHLASNPGVMRFKSGEYTIHMNRATSREWAGQEISINESLVQTPGWGVGWAPAMYGIVEVDVEVDGEVGVRSFSSPPLQCASE